MGFKKNNVIIRVREEDTQKNEGESERQVK